MQRKLVRQGQASLTISLPAEWVKKHQLREGQELSIAEVGEALELSTQKKLQEKKARLNIQGQDDSFIWREFMGLYRAGFDEILVIHKDQLPLLTKIANQFIGYAITNQSKDNLGKDRVIITDLGGLRELEFAPLFRRLYYLLLDALAVNERFLQEGKINQDLELLNITVNQFSDYCLRYLNKRGLGEPLKTTVYSQLVSEMEVVVDVLLRLSKEIPLLKAKEKERKAILEIHRCFTALLRGFYEQLFKFEGEELAASYKRIYQLGQEISSLKNSSCQYHYLHLISLLKNATSQIIVLQAGVYAQ